jgi:hypothetical protein
LRSPQPIRHVLLDPGATALNQNDQYDDSHYTGDNPDDHDIIHSRFSLLHYLRYLLKDSMMTMIAGPRVTKKSDGKMKKTSGKTSLTDVFAACSSTL